MKHILLLCSILPLIASAEEVDSSSRESATENSEVSAVSQQDPTVVAEDKAQESSSPLRATLSLSDGGVLNGSLRQEVLPVVSDTLGSIRLDLHRVESIAFESAGGPARISFHNGDRLTARIAEDVVNLGIDTLLGALSVPLSSISAFSLALNVSWETGHASLLYYCTFDSPAAIEHPAAGPTGRFLGGEFVPGKRGKSLWVGVDRSAFETRLPRGFLGSQGTIEFWAKIGGENPSFVDGGDPLFFSLYDERDAITLLQFAANNGFGRGGLGGAMVSWPFGTVPHNAFSMDYTKILGPAWADWHHYALAWNGEGFGDGTFIKVFIDGCPQPVFGGVDDAKVPSRLANVVNHSHELGIPWHTSRAVDHRRSKKPFLIDEFKIWSVAKVEF